MRRLRSLFVGLLVLGITVALPAVASTVWEDINTYTQRIAKNPEDTVSYQGRAEAYVYLKEYDKALSDLNQSIAVDPTDDLAFIARGELKQSMNDIDGALKDYKQAIAVNPDSATAYKKRALVYWIHREDQTKACADIDNARELYLKMGLDDYKVCDQLKRSMTAYFIRRGR